jgi:peptidoglycan/LPS O-acetylase OafA/YrhL
LQRSLTIDVLKMFAAQMIVWHHIAAYGLIAETLKLQWPVLMNTIYDQARVAVQIFLVVAGYLAAQSLSHRPMTNLVSVWRKRYSRLALPFVVALLWVMMTVALTRQFIHGDWLPEAPHAMQFLAHAFFLSELLDFPALSSGVWYVAIDFQLYALMALLVYFLRPVKFWYSAMAKRSLTAVVAAMCLVSLFWFNRFEAWDDWAIYFFGSYGLGVLAAWAKRSDFDAKVFACTFGLGALSLFIAFRSRICLALITSLLLYWRAHIQAQWGHLQSMVHRLANSSYALFLTHFGVIVLFNALWTIEHFTHPLMAVCFALLAWLCSVAIGLLFHERVETALQQWRFQSDRFNFWRATN